MFKKIGNGILSFFKNHTIIAILLVTAIVLTSVWTPIIVKMTRDNKSQGTTSSSTLNNSGPSVFDANAGNQSSGDKIENTSDKSQSGDNQATSSGGNQNYSSSENEGSSNIGSGNVSSDASSSQTETQKEKLKIICWGDSITQGMGMDKKDYPNILQTYLGDNYDVLNAGVPGESSVAIAARQGAEEVFLGSDVIIKSGKKEAYLGNGDSTGLVTKDGKNIDFDNRGYIGWCEVPATVIYIDGVKYRLGVSNEEFYISTYQKAEVDIMLKKGSKIEFNSSRVQQEAYCEVILIGANDGLAGSSEDIAGLTARYKKMAERRKNDKYLVIVPYWLGNLFDKVFVEAFGDKAINFRQTAITSGLYLVGLKPGPQDEHYMKQGYMPPTLMYQGGTTDPLHLSEHGYKLMALLVYERGAKLKYW